MAFIAGDRVYLLPRKGLGQEAAMLGGGGSPLSGFVDAVASPSVRVTWGNGLTTQYLADGAQLLANGNLSVDATALLHKRVRLNSVTNNPAATNGSGASEGLVINVFAINIASVVTSFVVVKFSGGDVGIFNATGVTALTP